MERIAKKDKATVSQAKDFNPFLPPEPELTVCSVDPHHYCVLNKFNVFNNHLLLITREYQPQMRRLDLDDMRALCALMEQREFLAFYNGGPLAGSSQRHKHMQVIPLPYGSCKLSADDTMHEDKEVDGKSSSSSSSSKAATQQRQDVEQEELSEFAVPLEEVMSREDGKVQQSLPFLHRMCWFDD